MAITPFKEQDIVDQPQSLYAASKRANELMAYSYSHQYQIPTTGLRFFTVYGPWGRPDMAVYNFTKQIDSGRSIDVYGEGEVMRDFTYVDDVVEAITYYKTNSQVSFCTTFSFVLLLRYMVEDFLLVLFFLKL